MSRPGYLINMDLVDKSSRAVRGEGIYLFDETGRRYIDGCSGALVSNFGHSANEIAVAMADQARNLSYVYRNHFSSPIAEELAARFCHLTDSPMGGAYFTNSGSEAVETAVKLARVRHLAAGESDRYKIISRWQSYHGITMGALSWSGLSSRRSDYQHYFKDSVHISPAYCYRCWFDRDPESCDLACAGALENAILTEGPETVSAFIAEPVVGSALAAACPPDGYFRAVRDICDRYGVLFVAEEVMTGAGRTGGKYFASDHFGGRPDIITFGKGTGGGYYPLAGVLVRRKVMEIVDSGSDGFAASQSHSGHPVGMAAGHAALDFMEKHDLLHRSEKMGIIMGQSLEKLRNQPLVGDIRGKGLMWGVELVRDKITKTTFDPGMAIHMNIYGAAREMGLIVLPSGGCDRGQRGDMVMLAPPLVVNGKQIEEMVDMLDAALDRIG